MNFDTKYKVTITFNQILEGLQLTLVDGNFNTIFNEISERLEIELTQGAYQLKATFIDYYQEYLVLIDTSGDFIFDFNYPSVAPILKFKTTHEYFHGNSEYYSKLSTLDSTTNPNFLFFGAKYYKEFFPNIIMENCLAEYSIYDKENKLLFEFNKLTCKYSNEYAWFAFSNKLIEEMYFLKWSKDSNTRIFPFYIFENYQTQFFIRYNELPDFENCFFYYTNKMGFKYDAEEYLVLDKILFAFKDYKNYKLLTKKDRFIIQHQPYLVSLIHILQQSLAIKNLDFASCGHLQLPDLHLLSNLKDKSNFDEMMPVISSVMTKYAVNKKSDGLRFKPASIIDRTIDHIKYDLYWNNFSKIDELAEWNDIYSQLIQKSKFYPISNSDNHVIKMGKTLGNLYRNYYCKIGQTTIQERMNSLLGNVESEDLQTKIDNTINSIGDVSQIADKLNIPVTKVLRNYAIFKNIFNKIK
jgi:hypothetical protein